MSQLATAALALFAASRYVETLDNEERAGPGIPASAASQARCQASIWVRPQAWKVQKAVR